MKINSGLTINSEARETHEVFTTRADAATSALVAPVEGGWHVFVFDVLVGKRAATSKYVKYYAQKVMKQGEV